MIISVIKTSDSVTTSLKSIINALNNQGRRTLLIKAGEKFVEMTKANFGGTGPYLEAKWPSLSSKYAKKIGSSKATLKRSGALFESIKLGLPRSNWIQIYTKNPYAAAHTLGNKKQNIPQRNFWPMQIITPSYTRPLYSAEKELVITISKQLTIQSSGQLPSVSSTINRSTPEYGSLFTPPSN